MSRSDNINLVDKYIGTAYDVVHQVYEDLDRLRLIADNIDLNTGPQGIQGYTPQLNIDFYDGARGDFVSLVYQNSISIPATPGGGSYDGSTELPPTGWAIDPTTPSNGESTWVTKTKYSYDPILRVWFNNTWGTPARFSGVSGTTPVFGVDYFDGNDGAFVSFIYRNSITIPVDPSGGSFDGTVETMPVGWTDEQTSPLENEFVWVSTVRYTHNGAFWIKGDWSTPSKFSGLSGKSPILGVDYYNGIDGTFTSFVFKNGVAAPTTPSGGSFDGTNEIYPSGWDDDPAAPSAGAFVWISRREYQKVGEVWIGSDWTPSSRFSGEDGYTPILGVDFFDASAGTYTSYVFINSAVYPDPLGSEEGSFDGETEVVPVGWADDPSMPAVGELTYVSVARYTNDGTSTWVNQGWSTPTQFSGSPGENADDGKYISYIYDNAVSAPSTPTGGTFDGSSETYPVGWTDAAVSAPAGEVTWSSRRIYDWTDPNWVGGVWSTPARFSGVPGTDGDAGSFTSYIFRNSGSAPATPTGGTFDGATETWPTNWGGSPSTPGASSFTWVSVTVYEYSGGSWSHGTWSAPSRLSGTAGNDGATGLDGNEGPRGSGHYYFATTGSTWPSDGVILANYAGIGETLIEWDVVTYHNSTIAPANYSETRYWTGSVWAVVTQVIDGSLVVNETIISAKLATGSVTAGKIDVVGTTTSGAPVGQEAVLLLDPNAALPFQYFLRNSTTEAWIKNIFYVNSAGDAYFDGELAAATGTFAGSLSAATGSFAGSLSAATGTFAGSLSAATGTFSGNLSAAGGSFTGSLSAGSAQVDTLNIAGNAVTVLQAAGGTGSISFTFSHGHTSAIDTLLTAGGYFDPGANTASNCTFTVKIAGSSVWTKTFTTKTFVNAGGITTVANGSLIELVFATNGTGTLSNSYLTATGAKR